jgi:hypothetical protein
LLGDREFCGVELGRWLSQEQQVYLSLRLKKNEYVELEEQIWFQLSDLGLTPGMSVYYQGVKVTKTKGFAGFNLAAKWKSAPPALRFPQRIGRSKKKLSA